MNQNLRRSDITYGIKKDQNVKSHFYTFDILFDIQIFDVLIFQRCDHPLKYFRRPDSLTKWFAKSFEHLTNKNNYKYYIKRCNDLVTQWRKNNILRHPSIKLHFNILFIIIAKFFIWWLLKWNYSERFCYSVWNLITVFSAKSQSKYFY